MNNRQGSKRNLFTARVVGSDPEVEGRRCVSGGSRRPWDAARPAPSYGLVGTLKVQEDYGWVDCWASAFWHAAGKVEGVWSEKTAFLDDCSDEARFAALCKAP